MGNRAIIKPINNNKAVYLHWNGGRDSVEAFLHYCELRGFREFGDAYGMARFCQVVGNFFGADGLSLGVVDYSGSAGDNGVYIIDGWEIVDRINYNQSEQKRHDFDEMLIAIDEAQPKEHRLGDFLKAERVLTKELKIGDKVYQKSFTGRMDKYVVMGFGADENINGSNVLGIPFVNRYADTKDEKLYSSNVNNYIYDKYVRKVIEKD